MRKNIILSCTAIVLTTTSVSSAARWFDGSPPTLHSTVVFGEPGPTVRAHLEAHAADLDLVGIELGDDRVVATPAGSIVRLKQMINGIPVLGGGVVVRLGRNGAVRRIGVDVLQSADVDTVPTLDIADAHGMLEMALEAILPEPAAETLVVIRADNGRLVWQLDMRDAGGATRYWVDAHTGELVAASPLARDVMGRVYAANSVETPEPMDVELALLDATADPLRLNGWDGLLKVANSSGGEFGNFLFEQSLGPSAGQDFLYDPPASGLDPSDAFAQVNLYHHLTSIRSFFQDLGVSMDQPTWSLTAIANVRLDGAPWDNAFFMPQGANPDDPSWNTIAVGQGTLSDFSYDADVLKHELVHYVSHNAVGYSLGQFHYDALGPSPFSQTIDEGVADYFACSENEDAQVGEGALQPLGVLRDLTDTSKRCPDDLFGEVHNDGELIGSYAWTVRELLGKARADELIWSATASMPEAGYISDFAEGVVASATEMKGAGQISEEELSSIVAELEERGLDQCGRVLTLKPGEDVRSIVLGLQNATRWFGGTCADLQAADKGIPSVFHFEWNPGPSDKGVRLKVNVDPLNGGDMDYSLYARVDGRVAFPIEILPSVETFDYEVSSTSETSELIIDASSAPPFDSAAKYDLVLFSRGCADLGLVFSAEAYDPNGSGGGGEGGAGGNPVEGGAQGSGGAGSAGGNDNSGDGDHDPDGCGCRVAGPSHGTSVGVLGLMGLIALRLRRKRHNLGGR